jgi:hypothetical protein
LHQRVAPRDDQRPGAYTHSHVSST